MISIHCIKCHCLIHMDETVQSRLRTSHAEFYCLNGHAQAYTGPTPIEKARDAALQRAERAEREAQAARERADRIERQARLDRNKCEHCVKKFDSPEKLRAHVKRVHTKTPRLPANAGESN